METSARPALVVGLVTATVLVAIGIAPQHQEAPAGSAPSTSAAARITSQVPVPSDSAGSDRSQRAVAASAASTPEIPWRVGLRLDSDGDPRVLEPTSRSTSGDAIVLDPAGDAAPHQIELVDIIGVEWDSPCYSNAVCVYFELDGEVPRPLDDPTGDLVVYGLAVDKDRDGVADALVATDNADGGPRIWRRDLKTGDTVAWAGTWLADEPADTWVPWFRESATHPVRGWIAVEGAGRAGPVLDFYLWAAVIRDGEIVSTDFVPDVGWLDAYQG